MFEALVKILLNISREPIGSNTKLPLKGSMGVITYLDSTLYKLYGDIVFIAILAFLPVIPFAIT